MKRVVTVICMLFFLDQQTRGQLPARPLAELEVLLQQDASAADEVQTLLQLTLYYYFDRNEITPKLDKMYGYLQQAQQISNTNHSKKWQNELDCYFGKYCFRIGNKKKGNEYFEKLARNIANSGGLSEQVANWRKLAGNIRALDSTGLTRIDCFLKLRALYEQANDREKVIEMEKAIADTHLKQGKLDIAEKELLSVLNAYKSIRYKRLHYTYTLLSSVNWFKGNYNTALYYALLTIESMRSTFDSSGIVNFYCHLAWLYDELGQEEKSAENFCIAFNRTFTNPIDFYNIRAAGMYARVLVKQNKPSQALAFIQHFVKLYPPVDNYGRATLARTLAWYYRYNDPTKSEKYIHEMIRVEPLLLRNNEVTQEVAYDLGNYFLEKKDFTTAAVHFNHALTEAAYVNSVHRKKDVHLMLFKTDSSLGRYVQAIKHMNQYRRLSDSTFTVIKNRQLQEVQVKYETDKKDKDLSLKDKNIQLLTKQSQLQTANLKTEKNTKNAILACTGLLILLLALSYNQYKLKQRNNLQLEAQQQDIKEKNSYLQHLILDKEWLVKEIHHRVKNNFHTVIGLLGTQSNYLKNEEAIGAMAESQQRIQAMSLIHQKLYQSETMSDIDMADYIHELVDYLKDSLNTDRRILFHFQLDHISLGVYHAVPIGLILNETITNAIKYAFPDDKDGNIYISFKKDSDNESCLVLVVTDDGTGLPLGFDDSSNITMGMNLMKGLAKDIDGEFTINSTAGTTVTVAFTYHKDIPKNHSIPVEKTSSVV